MSSFGEKLQAVSDQARAQFGAITIVTAIVPIARSDGVDATSADFDFLAAVANHIYYLENLDIIESIAITGSPRIRIYDITPVVTTIFSPNLLAASLNAKNIFCTRLRHQLNGASAGEYSIVYSGFDITYT